MKLRFRNYSLILSICATLIFSPFFQAKAANDPIVDYTQTYTYDAMTYDITVLAENYPDLIEYKSLGKSPFGKDLWAVKLGKGEATIFINGSHHAREWISSTLNMYMIEQYAKAYTANEKFGAYPVREILDKVSIWFVPMVNPDGVTLQQKGVAAFPKEAQKTILNMNNNKTSFKHWKANATGVDLNRQYPANWNNVVSPTKGPSSEGYKGTKPFQTKENIMVRDFTYEIDPEIAISYHSSGRVLFWSFLTKPENLSRDQRLATEFATLANYKLMPKIIEDPGKFGGGYTDWFIQEFGRPAFTPELSYSVGNTNPPTSVFPEEWNRNKLIGLWAAQEGYNLWYAKNKGTVDTINVIKTDYINNKQAFDEAFNAGLVSDQLKGSFETSASNLIDKYLEVGDINNAVEIQKSLINYGFTSSDYFDKLNSLLNKKSSKQLVIFKNGKEVKLNTTAFNKGNETYVPIREIANYLGLTVDWDVSTQSILLTKDDLHYSLNTKGSNTSVIVKNATSFIPVSYLQTNFQDMITWNPLSKLLIINEMPIQ